MFRPAKIVRIDPDEIRDLLPEYKGNNSNLFQGACSLGVEKIHDFVLRNNQNFTLDGTLVNYDKAISNIKRSIEKGREVSIFLYIKNRLSHGNLLKREKKLSIAIFLKILL